MSRLLKIWLFVLAISGLLVITGLSVTVVTGFKPPLGLHIGLSGFFLYWFTLVVGLMIWIIKQ